MTTRVASDSTGGTTRGLDDTFDTKTDELWDIIEWLGELVRQVDSSLLDEWEELQNPADLSPLLARMQHSPGRIQVVPPDSPLFGFIL